MVKTQYVPTRGDVVWVSFNPTSGHEQKGFRPALVISSKDFNKATGLSFVCPISSVNKGYAHHIPVSGNVSGFVLAEHLRSIDWKARKVRFEEKTTIETMCNVLNCLEAILR